MKKNFSIASLIAITGFMISTFVTAKFHSSIGMQDKFGYPFTFFSAFNEGEELQNKEFSGLALLVDFSIYLLIAFLIVSLIGLLKIQREKSADIA
jgi:hypothetical protein